MPWRDEIVSSPMVSATHLSVVSALIDLTGLGTIIATASSARATADLYVDFFPPGHGWRVSRNRKAGQAGPEAKHGRDKARDRRRNSAGEW